MGAECWPGCRRQHQPAQRWQRYPAHGAPQIKLLRGADFFDNYEAGLILWENPTQQQINLLIAPSLEQLYFRRWQYASRSLSLNPESIKGDGASDSPQEAMRHLRHRHTSALGGFEYNASLSDVVDGLEFNWQFWRNYRVTTQAEKCA